jgi:biopolymer transport protein ExbB
MFEIFFKGGPVMWPILACSIVAVAILLERLYSLRRSRILPQDRLVEIGSLLKRGRIKEALAICRNHPSPMTAIIMAGIVNHKRPRVEIREAIEDAGRHEVSTLRRYLPTLSAVVSVSPMLGLLGTVTGMIKVFQVVEVQGAGEPAVLAGGIWEALLTTAAGLAVAIPALAIYHYLSTRADRLLEEMEKQSIVMLNIIAEVEGEIFGTPHEDKEA